MSYSFDHIAQQVPNIAEAVQWYQEHIPGTRVLFQDSTWAFIDAGGAKIAFVVKSEHPPHLAWRVSAEELERLAIEYGKEIDVHRDKTRSFYLDGPGGNAIEIISVEGSPWESLTVRVEPEMY